MTLTLLLHPTQEGDSTKGAWQKANQEYNNSFFIEEESESEDDKLAIIGLSRPKLQVQKMKLHYI